MVQPMLITKLSGFGKFFSWNLDSNVGSNSPNQDEDVALVQLGYFFLARSAGLSDEDREIFGAITPGEGYGGLESEPLTKAIRHHQKRRKGTQDGHVSVVRTDNGQYQDPGGTHTYQLVALINNVFDACPNDYPRIDMLGDICPPVLRAAIIRECAPPPPPG